LPKKENNGKAEEYQFKLVGQYTTVEAQKILLGLINSKINFHQLEISVMKSDLTKILIILKSE
jgi:hypothetical protein